MAHPAKIRILYLVPSTELGGAEISFLSLLTHLDKERFEPCVLISSEGPLVSKLRHLNIPLMTYNKTPNLFNLDWLLRQQLWFRLRKQLQDFQPALIHSNSIYTSTLAQLLGKKLGCPQCHHWRDDSVPKWMIPLLRKQKNSHIISVSNTVKDTILNTVPGTDTPIDIIPNGVNLAMFHPKKKSTLRQELGVPDNHVLVGFFAALRPFKGLHLLLEGLKKATPINISFLIVGNWIDRPYKNLLQPIIEHSSLSHQIHAMGFQDNPIPFMQAVDCVAIASKTEACCRVILEAFACGKPIIGHQGTSIPEFVTHQKTGLLINKNTSDNWKSLLIQLSNNPSVLEPLSHHALEESKTYCIKTQTNDIEELYETLVPSVIKKR